MRRAAVALKTQGHNLPEKRREELQQLVRGYVNQDKPGSQLDGGGWLSQDEMESALLAGLAPRQKRRTLRQLAVERAGNSDTQSDGAAQHHKSSGYEEGADSDSQECDMTKQAGNDVACVLESAAAGFDAQQSVADSEGHMQQQFAQHTSLDTATSNTPSEVNDDTFAVQHSDVLADQAVKHGLQGEAMTAAQHAESNGHLWHGKMVVAAAMAEGGTDALLLLIHRFRKAFTDALHPQFLPEAWHIFHNADRDFGEHSVYAS